MCVRVLCTYMYMYVCVCIIFITYAAVHSTHSKHIARGRHTWIMQEKKRFSLQVQVHVREMRLL